MGYISLFLVILFPGTILAAETVPQGNQAPISQVPAREERHTQDQAPVPLQQDTHPSIQHLQQLARAGAPELALRLVDRQQPPIALDNLKLWSQLENLRLQLLEILDRHQARLKRLQDDLDNPIVKRLEGTYPLWLKTQKAKTLLQLGRYTEALKPLRELLWYDNPYAESEHYAEWRRLIIRAYLGLNQLDDAQRAMQRYFQDYGDTQNTDLEWQLQQASLLIRTGRPGDAIPLLEGIGRSDARGLLLLAQFRAKLFSADKIRDQIKTDLENTYLTDQDRNTYRLVDYLIDTAQLDIASQVGSLQLLLSQDELKVPLALFPVSEADLSADKLWDLNERWGYQLANQAGLLLGDDAAWYLQASNRLAKQPGQAVALLTVLGFHARDEVHRQQALEAIATQLDKQDNGLELIQRLFQSPQHFTRLQQVPRNIRYRLVDYALSRARLDMAARFMETLPQPPAGEDDFAWQLRRARILILGGQYQEGAAALRAIIQSPAELAPERTDALMQVLFDLQNVEQHKIALALFTQMEQRSLPAKLVREINFWKAESYEKLGQYESAAWLFLKSAKPLDDQYDPWFETATYRAGDAMLKAGLLDDARHQFNRLLRITANQNRRTVLRQKLQQILLKQNAAKAGDGR